MRCQIGPTDKSNAINKQTEDYHGMKQKQTMLKWHEGKLNLIMQEEVYLTKLYLHQKTTL